MAPISTGLGEIYFYVLRYKEDTTNRPPTEPERLMQLKLVQKFIVAPMLVGVRGVTEVNTAGGYDKQIVVFPDPQKLMSVGLSYAELAQAIGDNTENAGGSVVEQAGENITIRSVGRVYTTEEVANLPVKFGAGRTAIRVKDVAEAGIGSRVRTGAAVYNGEEALIGTTLMLLGENSRLVAQRVHEKIAEVQNRLPPGMEIKTVYNRTELVNRTIAAVEKIPGAADVEFDAVGKAPIFEVAMNREAMTRYNVHAGEVNEVIETAFAGKEGGVIIDGIYRYPVVVRLPEPSRRQLAQVAQMPVRTSDGGLISLEQVATMNVAERVNTINREAYRRRMTMAVLNGVVLITFFNQLREQGRSVRDAVKEGALTRLRPVLMTALVAAVGFIPMAVNVGVGGEVQRPLATVVIGGIFTNTLLTLLVLPALYTMFSSKSERAAATLG